MKGMTHPATLMSIPSLYFAGFALPLESEILAVLLLSKAVLNYAVVRFVTDSNATP